METDEVTVSTGAELVTDITDDVVEFCQGRSDGLVHVFLPHATAGLALIETGAGSERDLASTIDAFLPREGRYSHRHGSTGHGRDHVLPAFVAPFLVLPVIGGRLQLGTWQRVVIVDSNVDNRTRRLRLGFLAG